MAADDEKLAGADGDTTTFEGLTIRVKGYEDILPLTKWDENAEKALKPLKAKYCTPTKIDERHVSGIGYWYYPELDHVWDRCEKSPALQLWVLSIIERFELMSCKDRPWKGVKQPAQQVLRYDKQEDEERSKKVNTLYDSFLVALAGIQYDGQIEAIMFEMTLLDIFDSRSPLLTLPSMPEREKMELYQWKRICLARFNVIVAKGSLKSLEFAVLSAEYALKLQNK